MIIEYPSRKAKCKDCVYCGYYHIVKKNGNMSYVRRHKCRLTGDIILLSDIVCDKWKIGCGVPRNYDYIKLEEETK